MQCRVKCDAVVRQAQRIATRAMHGVVRGQRGSMGTRPSAAPNAGCRCPRERHGAVCGSMPRTGTASHRLLDKLPRGSGSLRPADGAHGASATARSTTGHLTSRTRSTAQRGYPWTGARRCAAPHERSSRRCAYHESSRRKRARGDRGPPHKNPWGPIANGPLHLAPQFRIFGPVTFRAR